MKFVALAILGAVAAIKVNEPTKTPVAPHVFPKTSVAIKINYFDVATNLPATTQSDFTLVFTPAFSTVKDFKLALEAGLECQLETDMMGLSCNGIDITDKDDVKLVETGIPATGI